MALSSYERMRAVFGESPGQRSEMEIRDILPWFRNTYAVFRNLHPASLLDIVSHSAFEIKKSDEIIIRQGDHGDCMYVLLRGKVTVYIQYAKADVDDRPSLLPSQHTSKADLLRHSLGTFVTHIVPGMTFGEVALMSDDRVRSASIVSEQWSELLVLPSPLYDRTVRAGLRADFEAKLRFIDESAYFQKMAPRFRKQLAMALQTVTVEYEGVVARQGEAVQAMYFIQSGEVQVCIDPALHSLQYAKLFASSGSGSTLNRLRLRPPSSLPRNDVHGSQARVSRAQSGEGQGRGGHRGEAQGEGGALKGRSSRRTARRRSPLQICLLGENECVGDIEVLLSMESYIQTAACSQRSVVLVLELKHFERLVVKRNPSIQDLMLAGAERRLATRVARLRADQAVPLYGRLLLAAAQREAARLQQEESRNKIERAGGKTASSGRNERKVAPPCVMSSRRAGHQARRAQASEDAGGSQRSSKNTEQELEARGLAIAGRDKSEAAGQSPRDVKPRSSEESDERTSEAELASLEQKMKQWLNSVSVTQGSGGGGSVAGPCRVEPFQRSTTAMEDLKPGVVVMVKPREQLQQELRLQQLLAGQQTGPPRQLSRGATNLDEYMLRPNGVTKRRLEYYKMALNAKVPNFAASNDKRQIIRSVHQETRA